MTALFTLALLGTWLYWCWHHAVATAKPRRTIIGTPVGKLGRTGELMFRFGWTVTWSWIPLVIVLMAIGVAWNLIFGNPIT